MTTSFDTTLAGLGINRSAASGAISTANPNSSLNQEDFLRLMTAQLNNQDPFEPVDNTQMVAQMAQFSSLAGQETMNSTLKAIADKLGATSPSEALSWVGHNVLTEGSLAFPTTSGMLEGAVELDSNATNLSVSIADSTGKTLRTIDMGAQNAGTLDFNWDGTTDDGEPAGSGPFTISVNARGEDGAIAARSLVWAPVTSVSLPASGGPVLTVPGVGQIPTSAIRKIG